MKIRKNINRRKRLTMTKRITRTLLIIGVIGGLMPYVLSIFDKQPVESMGIAWVTEIVAVCLGYFVRGFKDTAESERIAMERDLNGLDMSALYLDEHPELIVKNDTAVQDDEIDLKEDTQ